MSLIRSAIKALLVFVISGCGRAMPPRPPEDFAPMPVTSLQATASAGKLSFAWRAPVKNQMGDELSEIAGYKIQRRPFVEKDNKAKFETVGTVDDTHLQVLEQKRAEARAAGISGRKVKLPESIVNFSFIDPKPLSPGEYQVVAYQLNGQLGKVDKTVTIQDGVVKIQELK